MTDNKKRVMVAMSGGIDSSAVCLMLQDAGYEVLGMTMRVWDLPRQFDAGDDVPRFIREAQALAQRLGIKHHVVDVRDTFRQSVVRYFCDEYANGRTPNPVCFATAISNFASCVSKPMPTAASLWPRATT